MNIILPQKYYPPLVSARFIVAAKGDAAPPRYVRS